MQAKKLKISKIKLKDIPVYERLDVSLKTTYAQRWDWLKGAKAFVRSLEKNKKYPHWTK